MRQLPHFPTPPLPRSPLPHTPTSPLPTSPPPHTPHPTPFFTKLHRNWRAGKGNPWAIGEGKAGKY
ncbi:MULTISPECIES: hypothetical protein [unclassified Microcystis]|uniref:hypothetical protein n=1 Tax=unclassified Microcystis TaxID=2643300 RepID=UPI00258BDDF2|nr:MULTISPECIES: hypothetical protein [unclassified Microcystis]